ncbi:MAG TPA: DUF1501 domain-containing protein [Planctomycetota bacterium]|nr:DUF1501 domain-containing protein [Planctomycetota bacterium]
MKQRLQSLDTITRRSFAERCALAAFGLTILPSFAASNVRAEEVAKGPGFGKAKNIIWLRLQGGLSHIDTFDPKEGKSQGPAKALSTKAGFQVTDYLPKTAAIADKICVLRSMTAKVGVHADAAYIMRTGYEKRGTITHPAMGAWCQHYLGQSHKTLPSSVCINMPAGSGNGYFPATYSPLPILDPDAGLQHSRSKEGVARLESRLDIMNELDRDFRAKFPDPSVAAYNDFYENTLRLMKSSDLKAFDVSAESDKMRDSYGRNKFGQGCLLARRLVENGVRFIEVESKGWDMHKGLEKDMEEKMPPFDQAFSALVSDLESRGLLASTLVAVTTEFGRKPNFDGDGRGHHPPAFSLVLSGGGVKGGYVHGATDKLGAEPSDKPMKPGDFHATVGWAAGLPLEKPATAPNGRPFTVGNKGKPALEIFA